MNRSKFTLIPVIAIVAACAFSPQANAASAGPMDPCSLITDGQLAAATGSHDLKRSRGGLMGLTCNLVPLSQDAPAVPSGYISVRTEATTKAAAGGRGPVPTMFELFKAVRARGIDCDARLRPTLGSAQCAYANGVIYLYKPDYLTLIAFNIIVDGKPLSNGTVETERFAIARDVAPKLP